ncbi:MAG: ABC transporter substrate-binding protein [Bacteroidetes bacterium]|nr:ABC transporter substrate-binding protein [Bacteroidota bacterium]
MENHRFLLTSMLLLAFIGFSSCKKEKADENKRVLEIGVLLPLTGSGASPGVSTEVALQFAREDISEYLARIGSDIELKLTIEDTQTDTLVALEKIGELKNKGIQLVIGPYSSAEVKMIKPYANENDMLVVSPSSVAVSLAIPNDNILRLVPSDLSQGEAMDAWLNSDTIEILVPVVRDDIWGKELCKATRDKFTAHSGIMMDPVYYPVNDQQFADELAVVKNEIQQAQGTYPGKKIGIYLISFGEGTGILSEAAQDPELSGYKWYGSSAYAQNGTILTDIQASAFASLCGLPCPVFGLDGNAADKWQPLLEKLQTSLGRKPEVYALVAYDALWLSVLSYLNTGLYVSTSELRSAFIEMADNYFGVTGRTTLNESGDRAFATYDFWGVRFFLNEFTWIKLGTYNNLTGKLEKL